MCEKKVKIFCMCADTEDRSFILLPIFVFYFNTFCLIKKYILKIVYVQSCLCARACVFQYACVCVRACVGVGVGVGVCVRASVRVHACVQRGRGGGGGGGGGREEPCDLGLPERSSDISGSLFPQGILQDKSGNRFTLRESPVAP